MNPQSPRRVRAATGRLASVLAAVAVAVPLAFATGCGLISSDLAKVSFDLPPKTYTFDTGQADWNASMTGAFAMVPSIPCSASADCCPVTISAAGIDCSMLICDSVSASCAFAVTVQSPPQMIDLKNEAQIPSSLSNQSAIDITVNKLTYDVNQNTLNVDLPPVDLYVGPQGSTKVSDPGVVKFATVPAIPHATTLANGNIPLDAAANQVFENIGMHLGTPFVFLAQTQVVLPGGTPAPTGALTLTIKGQLSAKPNL